MKYKIASLISKILIVYFKLRYSRRVIFGKNIILNYRFKFRGKGTLIVGDDTNLWAHKEPNEFQTYSTEAEIVIGKNSRINGATIQCRTSIKIGGNCLIGSAIIMDHDFHSIYFSKRNDPSAIKSSAVVVGDKVWIAGQSAILKGVTVGNEAVVGFRAVVTKNVPEKSVVAGNPAQVVKLLGFSGGN